MKPSRSTLATNRSLKRRKKPKSQFNKEQKVMSSFIIIAALLVGAIPTEVNSNPMIPKSFGELLSGGTDPIVTWASREVCYVGYKSPDGGSEIRLLTVSSGPTHVNHFSPEIVSIRSTKSTNLDVIVAFKTSDNLVSVYSDYMVFPGQMAEIIRATTFPEYSLSCAIEISSELFLLTSNASSMIAIYYFGLPPENHFTSQKQVQVTHDGGTTYFEVEYVIDARYFADYSIFLKVFYSG